MRHERVVSAHDTQQLRREDDADNRHGSGYEEAERNGARLPATALIDQFYAQVQARGGGRWDTSSLMQLLAKD